MDFISVVRESLFVSKFICFLPISINNRIISTYKWGQLSLNCFYWFFIISIEIFFLSKWKPEDIASWTICSFNYINLIIYSASIYLQIQYRHEIVQLMTIFNRLGSVNVNIQKEYPKILLINRLLRIILLMEFLVDVILSEVYRSFLISDGFFVKHFSNIFHINYLTEHIVLEQFLSFVFSLRCQMKVLAEKCFLFN